MKSVQAGPLAAVFTPELSNEEVKRTVVLLHGYGAPGTDLVSLGDALDTPQGTRFVFLQAPHLLEGMSGSNAGRAWWHIDMVELQMARMTGRNDDIAAATPPGITEARALLEEALQALVKDHALVWGQTFLGGFSQGAMLSLDWTLHSSRPIAGLIQLSGTMICEESWLKAMDARAGLAVFQSHAPDDQVLPYVLAERLRDAMTQKGMKNHFVRFMGGHGIGRSVLAELSTFLHK